MQYQVFDGVALETKLIENTFIIQINRVADPYLLYTDPAFSNLMDPDPDPDPDLKPCFIEFHFIAWLNP
jgi:hypothetical protein